MDGLWATVWAEHVRAENTEQFDRFEDQFLGQYETPQAYVEHEETGVNDDLEEARSKTFQKNFGGTSS